MCYQKPIEKTVSDYRWPTRGITTPPTIDEYVQALKDDRNFNGLVPPNHSNWNMSIDDEVSVDLMIDFNFLSEDLKKRWLYGADWDGWLPVIKSCPR